MKRSAAFLTFALLLSGCAREPAGPPPAPAGAIPAGQSIGGAAIEGRALFEGTPPVRREIRMSEASCHRAGSPTLSEDVIVSPAGTLENVYVHVTSGLGERVFAPPAAAALMDQAGCTFVPHVLDVQSGQIVEFGNGDPVVHNVRAITEKNRAFNVSMPGPGKKTVRRYFTTPEIVKIRCDIHAWMSAYIPVEAHPFHQVTKDDGAFALRGLPSGTYTIEAWHERLGTKTQTVTVADGETARFDFTFSVRSAP